MDNHTEYTCQDNLKKSINQLLADFYLGQVQKLEVLDWNLLNTFTSTEPCEEDRIFSMDLLVYFVGSFSDSEEEIKEILQQWPKSYPKLKYLIHKLKGASAYTVAARFRASIILLDELVLRPDFIALSEQEVENCLFVLIGEMNRLKEVVQNLKYLA